MHHSLGGPETLSVDQAGLEFLRQSCLCLPRVAINTHEPGDLASMTSLVYNSQDLGSPPLTVLAYIGIV